MDWTWYLFGFSGRINRAKLWLGGLVLFGVMAVVALTFAAIQSLLGGPKAFHFGVEDIFKLLDPDTYRSLTWTELPRLLVKLAGTVLLVWIYLATAIKRLHDRNKSGWWMVPFFVVPGLYNQFIDRVPDSPADLPLALATFALGVWGVIEMFFLKGTHKTNRFGADPLGPPPPSDTRPPWDQQSEIEMEPHKAGPPPNWRVKPGYE
jgi:uncharacterized membrane protein YhaH (DUF805 family)